MNHRGSVLIAFMLITMAFMAGFPRVEIRTVFKDLLPEDDPFVQVYYDHPNFGNPLTMSIMIKRKDGDIYHADTLQKIWQMTRDIDLAPAVDHDQIISISTEKLRYAEATPFGIDMRPTEGSNLLWNDSEFNTAVRAINANFPGMNTLEIVLESRDPNNDDERIGRLPEASMVRMQIQRIVEADKILPPRATLSFTDYMMEGTRLMAGGSPKWLPLDNTRLAVNGAADAVTFGSNPINFGHVADFVFQNTTVSLWYPDNKQETVDAALASAQRAVEAVGVEHEHFRVRMATGFIALQQAMNNVVKRYHWLILGLVNIAILIISALAYRSFVAAFILLVPVNLSNFLLIAAMHELGIGLDINAVIVAVMGVGVGIDYGIYLLSRICEEFTAQDHNWENAITSALTTTGKAIMFTATIMLVGILPWYFLSDLKFMADMGLLLVAIMLINMVLSLVVLPLLVWIVKPKFAAREDLIVGEGVDLSKFVSAQT